MQYLPLVLSGISFITGLAAIKAAKPSYLRWLVVLLGLTVATEGMYYLLPRRLNHLPYTLFSFVDIAVWSYIFAQILKRQKFFLLVPIAAIGVMGCRMLELFCQFSIESLPIKSLLVYDIEIIFFSIWYLYSAMLVDYYKFLEEPVFFICAGCILYHGLLFVNFTSIAILSKGNYWNVRRAKAIFHILHYSANSLYYTAICIAYIISIYKYRQQKTNCPSL